MFRSNRCYNGGKQHRFESHYDEVPNHLEIGAMDYSNISEIRSLLIMKKYIKDVCVWCGKTIEREEVSDDQEERQSDYDENEGVR